MSLHTSYHYFHSSPQQCEGCKGTEIYQTVLLACDDQLTAWFYLHAAKITERECGWKGQPHGGSIIDNIVGYCKTWKTWPLRLIQQ